MQKKLIALAIAGLAGSAFAQSNVTMYGVADVAFDFVSMGGGGATGNNVASVNSQASKNRIATNGSYFGLKGAEDLGGGMKALYQIENEFDFGQGANNGATATGTSGNPTGNARQNGLANRDSFVGITGNFGTIVAGYLSSPHRSMAAKFDLMPGASGNGSSLNIIGRINVGSALNPMVNGYSAHRFGNTALTPTQRVSTTIVDTTGAAAGTLTANYNGTAENIANNVGVIGRHAAIAYVTPVFNGFQGTIAYVANETKDNANLGSTTLTTGTYGTRNPSAWNIKVDYDNGPLSVGYSRLEVTDFGVLGGLSTAGAGLPVATAGGSLGATGYQTVTTTAAGGLTQLNLSGRERHTADLLAAKYTFNGATTVSFMYDRTDSKLEAGPQTGVAANAGNLNAAGDITVKRSSYYLGLKHTMGMHDFTVAYAKAGKNSVSLGSRAANTWDAEGGSDANMWTLRYGYNFSKRTQAYAQYATIRNGANASYDFATGGNNVSGTGNATSTAGADPTAWSFGIRHNF